MKFVFVCLLAVCALAAVTASAPGPVFKAPYSFTFDNYMSDNDAIMSIQMAVSETNSMTRDFSPYGEETILIRGDLAKTYLIRWEEGKEHCYASPASSFPKTLDFSKLTLLDKAYIRGRNVDHYQQHFGPEGRVFGAYFDSETGYPVMHRPLFQFATMRWDFFDFNTSASSDSFTVPAVCAFSAVENVELVEGHILGHPVLNEFYGARVRFEQFKRAHGKDYPDHEEHENRFQRYVHHEKLINDHNAKKDKSYTMKMNQRGDWTDAEFKAATGRFVPEGARDTDVPFVYSNLADTTSTPVNWIAQGAVGLPRNQGMCGSCWSFGSSEALAGAHFIKTGELKTLSTQNLVDCSYAVGCQGCDGCTARQAWKTVMAQGGQALESMYPYQGVDGKNCLWSEEVSSNVTVSSYQVVPSGDTTAFKAALAKGPLAIAIQATTVGLNFYESGVYDDPSCLNGMDDLDHEVLAAGWAVDAKTGKEYAIVRNSWGRDYGVGSGSTASGDAGGDILIALQGNICGVQTDAVLPII